MANPFTGKLIAKIIGWAWVSYGVLSFSIGILGALTDTLIHKGHPNPLLSGPGFWLQAGIEVLAVVSGYMLTRLKPWAWVSVQLICAISLFWVVQDGVHGFRSMLHNPAFPHGVRLFAVGSIVLVTVIWSAVFLGCVLLLNLQRVKRELPPILGSHA